MNLATTNALQLHRPAAPGALGRLWASLRSFFVEDAGRASLTRPLALPADAPFGQQARNSKRSAWQDHPGYGVNPQRVIALFREAEAGSPAAQCDLFDDVIERDSTLRSLLEQRELAVAGKPHMIQAGGPGDVEALAAAVLSEAHEDLDTITMLRHQLGAARYGWAATEVDWDLRVINGREWVVPVHLANVPARRFRVDVDTNELRLVTDAQPQGEALRTGKWLVSRRPGPLARAGLMRTAIWPSIWKSFSARDWLVYAEMFGVPLVQAIYDDTGAMGGEAADAEARLVAEEIVRRIGSSGGATTPKSVEVKVHETRGADNSGTHGSLIALANAEMAKLINGATLTSDNAGSGGASYALGAVHASTRYDLVVADAGLLEEAWRRHVARPFMVYNGLTGRAPRLGLQIAPEVAPKTFLECADLAANKLRLPLSASQIRRNTGLREPIDSADEVTGTPDPAPAPAAEAVP